MVTPRLCHTTYHQNAKGIPNSNYKFKSRFITKKSNHRQLN